MRFKPYRMGTNHERFLSESRLPVRSCEGNLPWIQFPGQTRDNLNDGLAIEAACECSDVKQLDAGNPNTSQL